MILINVVWGGIVNEEVFVKILKVGRLFGVGFDVLKVELLIL